jgi:Icc protein
LERSFAGVKQWFSMGGIDDMKFRGLTGGAQLQGALMAPSSTRCRVLHISDLHLPNEPGGVALGQRSEATLAAVLGSVSLGTVDAVVVTGDITHDGDLSAYERAVDMLVGMRRPIRWTPGNHDDPTHMALALPEGTAPLDLGRWIVVPVCTKWPGHNAGLIAEGELDRVGRLLDQIVVSQHVVLAVHQPPVSPCSVADCHLSNPEDLFRVMAQHPNVRLVLSGHQHRPFEIVQDDALFVGAPSTCLQLDHLAAGLSPTDGPPGCHVIDLRPDGSVDVSRVYSVSGADHE